jgi:hypothetical protein
MKSNTYEIYYAYATSADAKVVRMASTGGFVVAIKFIGYVEKHGFKTYDAALSFVSQYKSLGVQPTRWSIDHPDNQRLLANFAA